jgi:hypothetical protein
MNKYDELKPRLQQDKIPYAILMELVELNEKLDKLIPKEVVQPIENEIIEKPKASRKKRGE